MPARSPGARRPAATWWRSVGWFARRCIWFATTQRIVPGLAHVQLVGAAAYRQLLADDQPGAIGAPEPKGRLRVATKFVNVAKRYYAEQGRQVDVIKLYGSMELAPLVGLADKIIDVVDTGNTLRANGLEPQELIATISSRLVVNKASMKMQHGRIQSLIDTLRDAVEARHRH